MRSVRTYSTVVCPVCGTQLTKIKLRRHVLFNVHVNGGRCCNVLFSNSATLWNHIVSEHYPSGVCVSVLRRLSPSPEILRQLSRERSDSIILSQSSEEDSIYSGGGSYGSDDDSNMADDDSNMADDDRWESFQRYVLQLHQIPPLLPGELFINYLRKHANSSRCFALADLSQRLRRHHSAVEAYQDILVDSFLSRMRIGCPDCQKHYKCSI
jgi:hypothetical protein